MPLQERPPPVSDDQCLEFRGGDLGFDRRFHRLAELEPIEAVGTERDHVGVLADRREVRSLEHFEGEASAPWREGDLDGFGRAPQVGNARHTPPFVPPPSTNTPTLPP